MSVLADHQIEELAVNHDMIVPFDNGERKPGKISSGTSSYGYDVRAGFVFKVFSPICASVIDPKAFDPKSLVTVDVTPHNHAYKLDAVSPDKYVCVRCGYTTFKSDDQPPIPDHILIPPHSFALAESLETFKIPRDILVVVLGKSTYARCGLVVNVTPGEPEWEGKWTIELSNTTPLPIKVYAGEGIMQCLFLRADKVCRVSYKDKKGRYAGQTGITLPFVEGDKS